MSTVSQFIEVKAGNSKEMPSKTVIYGVPKIGKTRFAAQYPDPFFIDVEGGLSYIGKEVRSTPTLKSYDEVEAWLRHIHDDEKFTCGTLVVDSLDWVETLAQNRLVKAHNAKNITDPAVKEFAYFRGVVNAADDAFRIIKWLDAIYAKKGIKSVLIAHGQIKEVDLPNKDPYQRNEMKLSKQLGARVAEWADLILFADYSFVVTSEGKTSEPKPVLYAGGSASFVGGGRMQLAKEIPLSYAELEKQIKS